jgi:dolichyl-phosphate mannosyltransferase polypeptide 3
MATQLQNYVVFATPFAALWMLIFAGFIELQESTRYFCLYKLPLIAIISFAVYSIYSVISSAAKINDCVEAQLELHREMDEARAELKKRKIIDDHKDK